MTNIVTVMSDTDDVCIALWRNLLVVVWRVRLGESAIELIEAMAQRMVTTFQQGFGLIQYIESAASLPSDDERRALEMLMQKLSGSCKCSAVIYEGSGFRASVIRSVETGINLAAKQDFPNLVFNNVEEALVWLTTRVPSIAGRRTSSTQLHHVLSACRGVEVPAEEEAEFCIIGRRVSPSR